MLRRGDQDGVDTLVVKHLPVVHKGFDPGELRFRAFELFRINVCDGDELRIRARRCFPGDGASAVSIADNAEAYAVVGA